MNEIHATNNPPLPPPTGYDSWLDYAVETVMHADMTHKSSEPYRAAARAELEQLRQTIKHNASDWAEDHTHAQEACKRFLPADKVDGDSYGVPGIQDLVDMLAVELAALRSENTLIRGLLGKLPKTCHYCGVDSIGKCPYGFPGCALADDITVADDETFKRLLDEVKALRELTRWRDASKERPTEEGEWYLCAHLEADPRNNRHDIFFFGFNGKGWLIPEPNTLSPAGRFIVTHWMPIPVPPKEPCSSHPPDHTS